MKSLFPSVLHLMRRSISDSARDVILTEYKTCGIVTLNRPKALNAISLPMYRVILPAIRKWNENTSISHIITEGVGPKAFCAGGDIRSVAELAKNRFTDMIDFFLYEYQTDHLIGTIKKPSIALIDGITMGAGAGISVHGKYRVATENTLFAMPETAIGLFTDVGGGHFLPRLKHPGLGAFLALTGHRLKGREVLWSGVATHYIESNRIETLKESIINLVDDGKSGQIDARISRTLEEACEMNTNLPAPNSLAPHLSHIEQNFALFEKQTPVTIEHIISKLSSIKSDPINQEWADKCLQTLHRMSPTSLKVTLRQLQEGSKLSLTDVFRMEYRLALRMSSAHDFTEGVRALILDKDNNPRWCPDRLSLVTDSIVDSYFSPLTDYPEWEP